MSAVNVFLKLLRIATNQKCILSVFTRYMLLILDFIQVICCNLTTSHFDGYIKDDGDGYLPYNRHYPFSPGPLHE